jgi:predicted AAA+ superfamily ATPase
MNVQRLRYRFLREELPDSSQPRIAVISGARQTGKTTLVRDVYTDLEYINIESFCCCPQSRLNCKKSKTGVKRTN